MKSALTVDADRYIELLQAETKLKALLAAVDQLLPHEDDIQPEGNGHLTLFCHGLRRQRQRLRRDLLAVVDGMGVLP